MIQGERSLPLSTVALVFGALSLPLAFARHLCSLAVVLAFYGLVFGLWGQRRAARHLLRYTAKSVRRAQWGLRLSAVGLLAALLMWALWASGALLS
jgi:hypothetical protein